MKDRVQVEPPVRLSRSGDTYDEAVAKFRCPHGYGPNDGRYTGTIYFAPFDRCGCCGINYPYIDSGSYGDAQKGKLTGSTRTWTKGRCPECGGHYEEVTW